MCKEPGASPWAGSIAPELANNDYNGKSLTQKISGVDFGMFSNKLTGALNYYHQPNQ